MSRFGDSGTFFYNSSGDFNTPSSTNVYLTLSAGQMPQYPFEETRITDKTDLRNLGGVCYSYSNYMKVGYKFKWTYLDESKTIELKQMFDLNPIFRFTSNGTNFGTFLLNGMPKVSETQFELYDIEMDAQEK